MLFPVHTPLTKIVVECTSTTKGENLLVVLLDCMCACSVELFVCLTVCLSQVVLLQFSSFSLEAPYGTPPVCYDSLCLYDGEATWAPVLGCYCGAGTLLPDTLSSGGTLLVVLQTDESDGGAGFTAVYSAVNVAGPATTTGGPAGGLQEPSSTVGTAGGLQGPPSIEGIAKPSEGNVAESGFAGFLFVHWLHV